MHNNENDDVGQTMPLRLVVWSRLTTGPLPLVAPTAPVASGIPVMPADWLVPRFHREIQHPTAPLVAVAVLPTTQKRNTQTSPRLEPLRFCFQCAALIPPWRDDCARHDQRCGRGLPRPVRLVAAPLAVSEIDTAEQPVLRLSA